MITNNYHPTLDARKELQANRSKGGIKFIDIDPPIQDEILDSKQVRATFNEYPVIPYSGTDKVSSHRLVGLLYSFLHLSTTFSGVVKSYKTYALGGKIDVQFNQDTIFVVGDEREVSNAQKTEFINFINQSIIFHNTDLKKLTYKVSDSIDATGMVGVEVITQTILDNIVVTVKFHRPTDYCFIRNDNIGSVIAISKKWEQDYIRKNPPLEIPVYPLEGEYTGGITRTFFFYQENGLLYGRPSDLSAIWDKYNEFKLKEYLTKKVKKQWIPEVLLETEDAETTGGFADNQKAQDEGYKDAADKITKKFTNQGDDVLNFVVTNRPYKSRPMFIHEFKGIQNADQIEAYREMFKQSILDANNFPRLLYDTNQSTGFSESIFYDVFSIFAVTKIEERQTLMEQYMNQIINYAFIKHNKQNELGIKFTSPIQALLDEYTERKRGNNQQSGSQGINSTTTASL